MLSLIVAKSKNNVIGKENKLLWHLPEDLQRFKKITINHTIIMGRKTFESIGRVLPKREHIVFSREGLKIKNDNVKTVKSIKDIKDYINNEKESFVIGGEAIYKLLMPYVKKMYITEINKEFEGDTYFPEIDLRKWKETFRKKGNKDFTHNIEYDFVEYERI